MLCAVQASCCWAGTACNFFFLLDWSVLLLDSAWWIFFCGFYVFSIEGNQKLCDNQRKSLAVSHINCLLKVS